jgi:hypothetical protein
MLSNKLTSNHSRTQTRFSSLQFKSVAALSPPPILLASIRTLYEPLRARCFLRSVKSGAAIFGSASGFLACRSLAVTQIRQFVDRFILPELLEPILSQPCYALAALANVSSCKWALRSGSYSSPVSHSRCSITASFRATATTALFLAFFPPRAASFNPNR